MKELRLGVVGLSEGNGHPYSWSAIFNGCDMTYMKACGFPVSERLYEQESYYCPHVSTKDYAAGWYDKLEDMQGKQNTYYAGEIISFGDMEDTCAASKDLVERFF